jgi:hypothetical protein
LPLLLLGLVTFLFVLLLRLLLWGIDIAEIGRVEAAPSC